MAEQKLNNANSQVLIIFFIRLIIILDDKVEEVTTIMSANVSKLLEREGKLNSMEERAEKLQAGTQMFQVSKNKWSNAQYHL